MRRFPVSAAPQPSRKSARPTGASAKVWIFRAFTALVLPVVMLLLFEGGLRLGHFGHPTGFFIPDDKPGCLRTNPDYVSLFLPGGFDLRQLNYRLAEKKPANTVRIVVLGESAAQGIPVPMFAFAPQLRAQLRARYPQKNVEVINTGVVAINSHVVYQIARDVAPYSPDLFVVYLGNNEVVGPYGPGCTYLSDMRPLWVIRLGVWVRSTRTGQLVAAALAKIAGLRQPPQEWGGMAMFVNNAVRGDDPRLPAVYRNFEANLRDLVRVATGAGAQTLLCTVVSNLKDSPPFLSLHQPGLSPADLAAWQQAFAAGQLAWKLGENAAARTRLSEAWRLDPQYADTAFMLGDLDLQAGRVADARTWFLAAQHWDALRFRPDPRLNEIIRAVARDEPSVRLVDSARLLGSDPASAGAPAGRELFFEHVHFDWEGNFRLARLMAEGAEAALFKNETGAAPWLDAAGCAAAVGYTPHERFSVLQHTTLITRHPPFTNQLTYARDQAWMARDLARAEAESRQPETIRRAQAVVQAASARDPDNPDLAKLAQELADDQGDVAGALAQARRGRELQPYNFALATDEAIKLARLGRYDEAEKLLLETARTCSPRDLVKMAPAFTDFYARTRRFADGRKYFDQLIAGRPTEASLLLSRGRLAQFAGDTAAAERDYRATLAKDPANQNALEVLVGLLLEAGRTRAAEELSLAAADFQPQNQANHLRVAATHEARDEQETAAKHYDAALHSGPAPAALHLRLATKLYAKGRRVEALDQLADAWQLSHDEGDPAVTAEIRQLIGRIREEASTSAGKSP